MINHSSTSPFGRWMTVANRLLFWLLVIITIAALILEFGVWKNEETHWGPFAPDPFVAPGLAGQSVGFSVRRVHPFKCCIDARGDVNDHQSQSDLRLWINDREIGPPHTTLHETIRSRVTSGFSHWDGHVIFALPSGVENTSATRAVVRYSLRPIRESVPALTLASLLLGTLAYRRTRWGAVVLRAPYFFLWTLGYLSLAASFLYITCSIYALWSGWALPTTALIRWSDIAGWAARAEPMLGYVVLACAGLGAVASWLKPLISKSAWKARREEIVLGRFFRRWSFLITTCAFVFSMSAMWAGIVRPGDLDGVSIGGLIAFSDANGYVAAAYDQAKDGVWSSFSLRRPLAAAFRSVLLFFGAFSIANMLLVQACLLSATTCLAASAVARWRGLWAGLAFFGLTYIYVRTFVPTSLTEPLGLCWALFSVPFFIEALRTSSLSHALLAFGLTTVALMTRMGSMFTTPALILWMVWQLGETAKQKMRVLILSISILFGVFLANFILQKAYGTDQNSIGSNLSYTLCGLTIGKTWDGCPAKLNEERKALPTTEEAVVKLMYSMAWDNFRKDPTILFRRLAAAAHEFAIQLPQLFWRGYPLPAVEPSWLPRTFLSMLSVFGVFYVLIRRREQGEMAFWLLLWASVVASAAFVFFDDGRRVLAASYPLLFLFFAMGITGPGLIARHQVRTDGNLLRYGKVIMLIVMLLFFSIPWLAHRLSPVESITGGALAPTPNEAIVFGGRRITGFLIVDDGTPLRHDIPTLHLSDFEEVIKESNIESYQELIHPQRPPVPFGFIFSPRLEQGLPSNHQFIVPPEVLGRREIRAWRFHTEERQKPGPLGGGFFYWLYVTHAEPLRR
jgi:hypothetical protein